MSGMVWLSSGVQNFQGHPGMICFRCFRCFAELRHSTLRRAPDLPQVSRPANKQARNTPTRTKVAVEIQRCFQSFVQLWKGSETAIEAIKSLQIPWKTSVQNNSNTIHFETFRIMKTSCDIHFHSNSFQTGCLVLRLKRRTKARADPNLSRVGWIDREASRLTTSGWEHEPRRESRESWRCDESNQKSKNFFSSTVPL